MENRGGRYFNQDGKVGQVGIHTVRNPNWYVESPAQRQSNYTNTKKGFTLNRYEPTKKYNPVEPQT